MSLVDFQCNVCLLFYVYVEITIGWIAVSNEQELGAKESEQVRQLLVSASRDCIPEDRNSFVEFQSNTGVEVTLLFHTSSSMLPL